MDRQAVRSGNLASVGYDAQTRTLEISFQSGQVYVYYDVPESEYRGLLNAGSVGSYFHMRIRNWYRYAKVG